jgi:hypothetical protein
MLAQIKLVDVVEHPNGDATYSFDLDKETVRLSQELGLKLLLYCGMAELPIEDAFTLIWNHKRWVGDEE